MNTFGKGLLSCSAFILFLIGCSELRSAKVSFTPEPKNPGTSTDGLPQQVTASPGCQGYVTLRLIYNLSGSDFVLGSCQELQFVNGVYTIKQSVSCSGAVTAGTGAITFSGLNHNCSGFLNLANGGKVNLACTGSLFDRMEADYAFRTSTQQGVNGVNVIGQLCQKQATVTNRTPTIIDPGSPNNKEGDSVNLKISASDPDGDILSYSATGLPTGLSINSTNGTISGTVAGGTAKTWGVTVTVSDNKSNPAKVSFVWTIVSPTATPGQGAYVMSVSTSASGAVLSLKGTVTALRYTFDSSGGWLNLSGPFGASYTINKIWPQGTTFMCAQAMGNDGLWHGTSDTDPQTCNQVTPSQPTPTTKTATLTWDPVTKNADGTPCTDLAGYIMYYSDVNGDWGRFPSKIVSAPNTSGTIANLQVGKTYYFAVSAFDTGNNESAKSQIITYTIP